VEPDPLPLAGGQRRRFVPDGIGHAESPETVGESCAAYQRRVLVRHAEAGCGVLAESRHCPGMTHQERRLQIHEVGDARQRAVRVVRRQGHRERRLGGDDALPRVPFAEIVQDRRRVAGEDSGDLGIELRPGAAAGQVGRGVDTPDAVSDFDVLRELGDPGRHRDLFARRPARPAAPVPPLVGGADRLLDRGGHAQVGGQGLCHLRVVGDHAVHLLVAADRELEAHPDPVQRLAAASQQPQHRAEADEAALVVGELVGLHGDVVAEPLGLLVRIGVTSDAHQQSGVVERGPLGLIEAEPVGDPQRDQTLPEDVLHGLVEAQIDAERQRRHELRESQPRPAPDHRNVLCHRAPGRRVWHLPLR